MAAITGLISSAVPAAGRFDEARRGRTRWLGQPCVCSFHSKCQTAARVRSFSRRVLHRLILRCERSEPRRMRARRLGCILRGSALRAEHLRMRSTAIVLAMRCIRVAVTNDRVLHHDEKKGGEAPKDACHPMSAPFLLWGGGAEAIHRRQACAVCATYPLAGTARLPALRCGTCPGERTPGLSPGRASRETRCEGVTSA